MADTRTIKKTNICFDCEKAIGGCSWARDFIPPEGCTYEPIYDTRKNGGGGNDRRVYFCMSLIRAIPSPTLCGNPLRY